MILPPKSQQEMFKRMDATVGMPFQHLPGNPPGHHVLGECSDGTKIKVDAVEMVFNDARLIDLVKGSGAYAATLDSGPTPEMAKRQREVYVLALKLYGREPSDEPPQS